MGTDANCSSTTSSDCCYANIGYKSIVDFPWSHQMNYYSIYHRKTHRDFSVPGPSDSPPASCQAGGEKYAPSQIGAFVLTKMKDAPTVVQGSVVKGSVVRSGFGPGKVFADHRGSVGERFGRHGCSKLGHMISMGLTFRKMIGGVLPQNCEVLGFCMKSTRHWGLGWPKILRKPH